MICTRIRHKATDTCNILIAGKSSPARANRPSIYQFSAAVYLTSSTRQFPFARRAPLAIVMALLLLSTVLTGCSCALTAPRATEKPSVPVATTEVRSLPAMTSTPSEISYTVTQLNLPTAGGQIIGGLLVRPSTGADKMPLVLCAHGLGGNANTMLPYAQAFAARGLAAFCPDFRGGGGTLSDGDMLSMSVLTEVDDLETVLAAARTWDFVDPERIALLGESQGGIVSAITAARHRDQINGLMLLYPAFGITDAVHEYFDSKDEIPDVFAFLWLTVGRPYAADMWDYDVYAEIAAYEKPVLIFHGTADDIVPIAYSRRADEVYADAEYHEFAGAGHGFHGDSFDEGLTCMLDYLQRIGFLST